MDPRSARSAAPPTRQYQASVGGLAVELELTQVEGPDAFNEFTRLRLCQDPDQGGDRGRAHFTLGEDFVP
jgi:hypothetical protein